MISHSKLLFAALSLLFLASGCTVQPLHSTGNPTAAAISDVAIESVDTRLEQQVRNRLIFLFYGGAAEPLNARFTGKLDVQSQTIGLLNVQRSSNDSDTTATSLKVTGTLELTDTSQNGTSKKFVRVARVSFDKTTQFFANSRALIDAEDRAAAELAEELRNLVAAYIKTL